MVNRRPSKPLKRDEEVVTKKRASGVTAAVVRFFLDNPNIEVSVQAIAKETGFTVEQVRAAINNLNSGSAGDGTFRIDVVVRGSIYRHKNSAAEVAAPKEIVAEFISDTIKYNKPETKLFEYLGKTKEGELILRAEDETLYRATAM